MTRYLILALNGPTGGDGDEEALNQWYIDEHLPAFKSIDAVKTARRYKVMQGRVPGVEDVWPYVAVYEIETDDIDAVSAQLGEKMKVFHPALDRTQSAFIRAVQVSGDD